MAKVLQWDEASGTHRFRCACGRVVGIAPASFRPGEFDYCGCGKATSHLTLDKVNEFRSFSGLPPLEEKRPIASAP